MSVFEPSPRADRLLAVLRVVVGGVFISAGTTKLLGYPPSPAPVPPFVLMSQLGIGAVLEVFGGLAIVLGALTRPIAFVLSGEMAVAYFQFHFPRSFFPTVNNGVPAVLFCFIFLYLSFSGAGAWSLDALVARARGDRRLNTGRPEPPD